MMLPAFEWHAFDGALPGAARSAAAPLHIGPARWLLVAPGQVWLAELDAAQAQGRGALVDVTGRWVPVETDRPLDVAAPLDLLLRDRDVAALWIFDCPVLVVRRHSETGVLVEASYAHSFRAMLATL